MEESSTGANARNGLAFGEGISRVVAKRPWLEADIGLRPFGRVGPRGGERERLDTDGTRVGRVCGGKEGEGGMEGGECVLCSVTLDTFDLTFICPTPPPLTTDDEPEWFSSLDELGASFGGE